MTSATLPITRRLPAEWEPQDAVWIAWPKNRDDWPGKFEPIPWVVAEMIRLIARTERVRIVVDAEASRLEALDHLRRSGANLERVGFLEAPIDRGWLRDCGPCFVERFATPAATPDLRALRWRFNAWAKYEDWERDDRLAARIAADQDLSIETPEWPRDGGAARRSIVLEGGAIDANGHGTLLTTEECLLAPVQERNPGFDKDDYEKAFIEWLGVSKVIWLAGGIEGDDTHGHVDDVARFVGPRTVVACVETDRHDPNFEPLAENLRRLRLATDQAGEPLEVVELPMPQPVHFDGQRLPASYANFLIANDVVLVPTFNDPADAHALNRLGPLFPARAVVGVHARDLVLGLGTVHCLTKEQPRGTRRRR